MRFFKPVFAAIFVGVILGLVFNIVPLKNQLDQVQQTPVVASTDLPLPVLRKTEQPLSNNSASLQNAEPNLAVQQPQSQTNPTATPTATLIAFTPTPTSGSFEEFEPRPPAEIVTCAEIWSVPEIPLNLPLVLEYPRSVEELYTEYNYYYLAAMLIQNKVVDASQCPYNGLQSATTANQCGVEVARPVIIEWQNQYDSKIFETGVKHGVPARLLKKIFAIESQFWPAIYIDILESGFGQLNDTGADALLLYSPYFYAQFCPLILHPRTCDQGYLGIPESARALLRGALVRQVNATCTDCPQGVNRQRALNSIPIFAEVVKANCSQINQIVQNTTNKKAGQVADYVDLWKFTMANYNAGPGCTARAIESAWKEEGELTWNIVSGYFTSKECQSAPFYVSDIFKD
ncbi:hypothetical protein BECAL_01676 [Bellilinea caldifistulae]|uniref:Transglycosylase SLT domain-containing protein n=1 Tax=Bellilinea caldifistulae TaxID=360411 RepID=A0A0P6X698_9CHLR|nr:hypothetical protein [Bellilinea caldifistulae]KPL74887.1 hypothetical protein AC812_10175 [Bellilinea caldifistulae]GAP10506.1 hypothetical protein BECAL_01676 [Bellilinea caldifistulae]